MAKETLLTYTGLKINFLNPKTSQINIRDIAHALSQICRFTGQLPVFYSVAEHSVLVSRLIELHTHDKELALAGLLHDASEAYLADIPAPVKVYLPDYQLMELNMQSVAFERFGLDIALLKQVEHYDRMALVTEFRDLVGTPCLDYPTIAPAMHRIKPLNNTNTAESLFLQRFLELIGDFPC